MACLNSGLAGGCRSAKHDLPQSACRRVGVRYLEHAAYAQVGGQGGGKVHVCAQRRASGSDRGEPRVGMQYWYGFGFGFEQRMNGGVTAGTMYIFQVPGLAVEPWYAFVPRHV